MGCTVSGKAKTLTTVPLFTAMLSAKYPSASSAQSTPCHGRFCPANGSRVRPASARGNSEIRGWDDVHAEAGAGPSTPVHWAHVAVREFRLRTSPGVHDDMKPLPQFFETRTGLQSSETELSGCSLYQPLLLHNKSPHTQLSGLKNGTVFYLHGSGIQERLSDSESGSLPQLWPGLEVTRTGGRGLK